METFSNFSCVLHHARGNPSALVFVINTDLKQIPFLVVQHLTDPFTAGLVHRVYSVVVQRLTFLKFIGKIIPV